MQKIDWHIDWKKEGARIARDYLLLALGSVITAASFSFFFLPHDIAPGGLTGVAAILADIFPLGVGLIAFWLNVPLFLLGWRQVGWRFSVRSFLSMTLLSAAIDLFPVVDLASDALLAALFGGAVMGAGLGLVIRAGATTGGTDLAAGVVHKRFLVLSVASILLMIDGAVVVLAALRFGLQAGFLALLACFVSSRTMDAVLRGINTGMQFLIITERRDEIRKRILVEMDRGCTLLEARGGYSDAPVGAMLCVVPRLETPRLKKIVYEVDPGAFTTICDVSEVVGEGFQKTGGF